MSDSRRVISVLADGMAGGPYQRPVHSGTGASSGAPEPADGKRQLIRGEGLVAQISDEYEPRLPVVGEEIPGPAVPCHVGTARLLETVNRRTRAVGHAVRRPYSDSDDSDNDVLYVEGHDKMSGRWIRNVLGGSVGQGTSNGSGHQPTTGRRCYVVKSADTLTVCYGDEQDVILHDGLRPRTVIVP